MTASLPTVADRRGRRLADLRISVTDRCNFRCTYCMPREHFGRGHRFLPKRDILSFEEIERVVGALRRLGLEKVRLTGGEPLLRAELDGLVSRLRVHEGLEIALTTNGSLLARSADALKRAGVDRLTLSLDALDEAIFRRMTDADYSVADVLEGLAAAERAGFRPIKVNCVVRRGVNESEILPLARHFRQSGHIVRFIEYMDVGLTNGWRLDEVVSGDEIVARITSVFPAEPVAPVRPGEVARRYRYSDGGGEFGVITSVTRPFCGDCTRLRLTADGKLHTCLFSAEGHDLRPLLRGGANDETLERYLERLWQSRDDRYSELRSLRASGLRRPEMSYVGG
jgi:cyclic pyranopterin phosphate synthase